MNLSFKQYLESKTQLVEAVNSIPKTTKVYNVKKYCSLPIGEREEEKKIIPLKPNQKIIVEWIYNDIDNPEVLNVKFNTATELDDEPQEIFWPSKKLQKWLMRYTTQTTK